MDHPTAEDLHPSRLRTGAAAGAAAEDARHVHLGRRLGEWEEARTHAHLRVRAEEPLDEVLERGAEVSDVDAFVHQESLGLMEHRRAAHGDLVAAEDAAAGEHLHRRLESFHGSDLHVRGVRAQQQRRPGVEEEGVLRVAGRVVGGEVEGLEVVPVRLHLGARIERVAHLGEDLLHLPTDDGDGMQMAEARHARGESNVDRFGDFF